MPHDRRADQLHVITPTQYPGQTATEPFARVHVWLDDTDVVLGYQTLLEVPTRTIRIGMRLKAVWATRCEKHDDNPRTEGALIGFAPTGEPGQHRPQPRQQAAVGIMRAMTSRSSGGAFPRWCAIRI